LSKREKYFSKIDCDPCVVGDGRVVQRRESGRIFHHQIPAKRRILLAQDSSRKSKDLKKSLIIISSFIAYFNAIFRMLVQIIKHAKFISEGAMASKVFRLKLQGRVLTSKFP
jgi:hypothetical protein